ncbi:type II toxin-antitoxin system VapB family antitoxin [Neorhizobium galegae]|nr:type II toxin-antitoxin system VapB family antitoxin [Neorhizobium galegae]
MPKDRLLDDLRAVRKRIARLPELEKRSDEDIVGFDEHGIPN